MTEDTIHELIKCSKSFPYFVSKQNAIHIDPDDVIDLSSLQKFETDHVNSKVTLAFIVWKMLFGNHQKLVVVEGKFTRSKQIISDVHCALKCICKQFELDLIVDTKNKTTLRVSENNILMTTKPGNSLKGMTINVLCLLGVEESEKTTLMDKIYPVMYSTNGKILIVDENDRHE